MKQLEKPAPRLTPNPHNDRTTDFGKGTTLVGAEKLDFVPAFGWRVASALRLTLCFDRALGAEVALFASEVAHSNACELLAARKVFISQRLDWEETRFMAKAYNLLID